MLTQCIKSVLFTHALCIQRKRKGNKMKKQAKIYSGGELNAEFDLPLKNNAKQFTDENGRSVKVTNDNGLICAFFEENELVAIGKKKYKTLQEAANAILAWHKAYRIY